MGNRFVIFVLFACLLSPSAGDSLLKTKARHFRVEIGPIFSAFKAFGWYFYRPPKDTKELCFFLQEEERAGRISNAKELSMFLNSPYSEYLVEGDSCFFYSRKKRVGVVMDYSIDLNDPLSPDYRVYHPALFDSSGRSVIGYEDEVQAYLNLTLSRYQKVYLTDNDQQRIPLRYLVSFSKRTGLKSAEEGSNERSQGPENAVEAYLSSFLYWNPGIDSLLAPIVKSIGEKTSQPSTLYWCDLTIEEQKQELKEFGITGGFGDGQLERIPREELFFNKDDSPTCKAVKLFLINRRVQLSCSLENALLLRDQVLEDPEYILGYLAFHYSLRSLYLSMIVHTFRNEPPEAYNDYIEKLKMEWKNQTLDRFIDDLSREFTSVDWNTIVL